MGKVEYEERFVIRYVDDAERYHGEWYALTTWERGEWQERAMFKSKVDAIAQLWKLRAAGKTVRLVRVKRRQVAS